jgi:hypothetical protein
MNGLFNKALQCFLRDNYGGGVWVRVAADARLGAEGFEPLLSYPPETTDEVLAAAARVLGQTREEILEHLGVYLVSHPNLESLRRLLRFGGVDFRRFLQSLEDVRARGRMVVPDVDLPELRLSSDGPDMWTLTCRAPMPGIGHVVAGLLRAMADDYGTLAVIDHVGGKNGEEYIAILLSEARFAEARAFTLAVPANQVGEKA